MEDERLADGAPGGGEGAHVQQDDEQQAHGDGHRRVDDVDEEAHGDGRQEAEQCSMPAEVAERWPAEKGWRCQDWYSPWEGHGVGRVMMHAGFMVHAGSWCMQGHGAFMLPTRSPCMQGHLA